MHLYLITRSCYYFQKPPFANKNIRITNKTYIFSYFSAYSPSLPRIEQELSITIYLYVLEKKLLDHIEIPGLYVNLQITFVLGFYCTPNFY